MTLPFTDLENLLLTRWGTWLSNGEEITHEPTCFAFHRNLGKDEKGYFIKIGNDFKRVHIEDTPYFVVRIEGTVQQGWLMFLSDGSQEPLQLQKIQYQSPDRLTCWVKDGKYEARFLRVPYFEFLKELHQDEQGYYLEKTKGEKIRLF